MYVRLFLPLRPFVPRIRITQRGFLASGEHDAWSRASIFYVVTVDSSIQVGVSGPTVWVKVGGTR